MTQIETTKATILETSCVGRHDSFRYGSKHDKRIKRNYTECKLLIKYRVRGKLHKAVLMTFDTLYVKGEFLLVHYDINDPAHVWIANGNAALFYWIFAVIVICIIISASTAIRSF